LSKRSHIAQHDKATIESIQTNATAGAMAGIAASKKQPTFEQLSLANISLSIVAGRLRWIIGQRARPPTVST
jgi:hypothetical protein